MQRKNIIHTILQRIETLCITIFFPHRCIVCEVYLDTEGTLCETCYHNIPIESAFYCPVCMKRLYAPKTCHSSPLNALGFTTSYTLPSVRELIHAFKYEGIQMCANELTHIVQQYLDTTKLFTEITSKNENTIVVPIPLHPLRERMRGFNQSRLLAQKIAVAHNLPCYDVLTRTRNNPPQAQMNTTEARIQNATHLFTIIPEKKAECINGKIVLLIDDVATSCNTLYSAADELKRHGAEKVIGLVVAKG